MISLSPSKYRSPASPATSQVTSTSQAPTLVMVKSCGSLVSRGPSSPKSKLPGSTVMAIAGIIVAVKPNSPLVPEPVPTVTVTRLLRISYPSRHRFPG